MVLCSSLPLLIVLGIQLCVSYALSIYFWRHICSKSDSDSAVVDRKDGRMKKLIILSCVTFGGYFIALNGFFITGIMHCTGIDDSIWLPAQLFSGQYPALIGSLTLIFMFILRLKNTFVDSLSIFGYSQSTMNIVYFLVFFDIFLCLLAGWLLGSGINVASGAVCIMLFMVLYIINWIILISMFYKKIKPMLEYKIGIIDGSSSISSSTNVKTDIDVIIVDIGSKSLSDLIKYTVAVTLGCITSISCYLVGFLVFAIDTSYVEDVASDVTDVAWGFDAITNQFAIIILFSFGDQLYHKYCQFIDVKLKDKFVRQIHNKQNSNLSATDLVAKMRTQEELKSLLFG